MLLKRYTIAFLLLISCKGFCQKRIFDTEANKHINENLTVSGIISGYRTLSNSKGILLYCGAHFPEQYFIVIIKNRFNNVNKIPHIKNIKGWSISVTGKIIKFKNMPAIIVNDWSDLKNTLFLDSVPNNL